MRRLIALLFTVALLVAIPNAASAGNDPPRCERGQWNALENTTANNSDDPPKHFGQFLTCLLG